MFNFGKKVEKDPQKALDICKNSAILEAREKGQGRWNNLFLRFEYPMSTNIKLYCLLLHG